MKRLSWINWGYLVMPRMGLLGLSAMVLLGVWQCISNPKTSPTPSNLTQISPHLYRGDMLGHRGLLFFAASPSVMTLVYDTARCGLYLAWKGPVLGSKRDGHGNYLPQGKVYQLREDQKFWNVVISGDTVASQLRMTGFAEDSTGYLVIHYAIDLPGGRSLSVDENPVHDDHYGDNALFRTFRLTGLDTNMAVHIRLGSPDQNWKTIVNPPSASGRFVGEGNDLTLVMENDGISVIKVLWSGSGDI
jgi:hypothetical protein